MHYGLNLNMALASHIRGANVLVPYADMFNHSFQPNCFFHRRYKNRMLEVMKNPETRIERGKR